MAVAVTGTGCISAACSSSAEALAGLRRRPLLSSDTEALFASGTAAPCFRAPLTEGGEAESPTQNRTVRLALHAISEALAQAGYTPQQLAGRRVGVALGTTVGCTCNHEQSYLDWKSTGTVDATAMNRYLNGNLAEAVQRRFGWRGPRVVVTNSCASATDAIGLAKQWLQAGLCEVAVAGGADELSRLACHGFSSLMLVTEQACRPFSADREGLNLGEGAGVVVLERQEQAAGRSRGLLRGYGSAADGWHPTAPHPEGRGLVRAVELALADAGMTRDQVAFINAHGTGTPGNDRTEATVLHTMGFAAATPVVSTKGVTGHTLGAAGGVETVFTLLTLNAGETGGTVGCAASDPSLPFAVLEEGAVVTLTGRIGLNLSLAFGGTNSVLVVEGMP